MSALQLQKDTVWVARLSLVMLLAAALLLPHAAWAAIDDTKLKAGAKAIMDGVQSVCLVALPVLVVAGFACLMYSGFSENFKRVAFRIISFAFVGSLGLFLFAQPIADLIAGTVTTGG